MKKIYFCLPAILTGVLQLSAQDIITKCNGEEIAAKVAEIGDTQIKYRKYENAQGPLYTLPAIIGKTRCNEIQNQMRFFEG